MTFTRQTPGWCIRALAIIAVCACAESARAQDGPSLQPATRPGSPAATRADLAVAYMRLEEAIATHPLQGDAVASTNIGFDRATLEFFAGRPAAAIQTINGLTSSLLGHPADTATALAFSLKVRVMPAVYALTSSQPIRFRATTLYPVANPAQLQVGAALLLTSSDGTVVGRANIQPTGAIGEMDGVFELAAGAELKPGAYVVVGCIDGGPRVEVGRWSVVEKPLDAVQEANAARLEAVEALHPELQDAITSCGVRNQLLTDHPSQASSSQFLLNPASLCVAIEGEIVAIESGVDPYRNHQGDLWRIVRSGDVNIPVRLYVPESLPQDTSAPVVIALHGAGGDENMFMEAYGGGLIKKLADEFGFIVASPLATYFGMNVAHFDALVEDLAGRYNIDRSQIYLLGHSMGAAGAAGIAGMRADKVAAACCISGVGGFGTGSMPPTLVIAAELDPLMRTAQIKTMVDKAIEAGRPLEYREEKDQGHTLVVTAVLPDAIAWLLKHRLPDTSREKPN